MSADLDRDIDLAAAARLSEAGWHDLARALYKRHGRTYVRGGASAEPAPLPNTRLNNKPCALKDWQNRGARRSGLPPVCTCGACR